MRNLNPFRKPNEFDKWLEDERVILEKLFRDGRIAQPLMDATALMGHPMTPEPYIVTQSQTTPALGTLDFTVLDTTLEPGYMAILTNAGHRYFGNNFVEGSGSLLWTYLIEYRPVPNLMNIIEQWGDQQRPRPLPRGIPVFAGQRIQIVADVVNTVAVGGLTKLIATVQGVKYSIR